MGQNGREAMDATAEEIVDRLYGLIGSPRVSAAYLRFRLDLLAAQRAARYTLAGGPTRSGMPPTGPFPLAAADVSFPPDILEPLLRAIQASAAAHGRETEDVRRLAEAAASEPALLPTLAAAAAFGPDLGRLEGLARRWGIYLEVLLFVGRALAAPCVAEAVAARTGGGPGPAAGEPHRCPACGSPPSIARLQRADGRRRLTCGLCGSEWEAVRLACTCCGTEEGGRIGVLRLEEADPRWVEACAACQGYIKTVDERRLGEGERVLPVVEEAATLHLDLLAEREGYIRRVPYVLAG